jgi:hypothetical protein
MNYNIEIQNIDLDLLREQKDVLLKLQYKTTPNGDIAVSAKEFEVINGLINLIDHIQDQAVEQHGLDENEVFNLNKEE